MRYTIDGWTDGKGANVGDAVLVIHTGRYFGYTGKVKTWVPGPWVEDKQGYTVEIDFDGTDVLLFSDEIVMVRSCEDEADHTQGIPGAYTLEARITSRVDPVIDVRVVPTSTDARVEIERQRKLLQSRGYKAVVIQGQLVAFHPEQQRLVVARRRFQPARVVGQA